MSDTKLITTNEFNRVSAALSELGVRMDGVCPNQAFKLLRWHILLGLSKEQLNDLAVEDSELHARWGITSYDGTYKFSLK